MIARFLTRTVLVVALALLVASLRPAFGLSSEGERLVEALALSRGHIEQQPLLAAGMMLNLGDWYRLETRYEEAEPLFREALDLHRRFLDRDHPTRARSLARFASLLEYKAKFAEAEVHFRTVVEFQPEFIKAWNNLGVTLLRLAYVTRMDPQEREKAYDRAIETFTQILSRFPDYANKHKTYYNRGLIYSFRGQVDLAVRDANKALELKPDYEEAKKLLRSLGKQPR